MGGSFKVQGAADLEKLLKLLPDRVAKRVTTNGLRAGGNVIAKAARSNAKATADTGALASKIRVRARKSAKQGAAAVSVGIGRGSLMVTRKGRTKAQKVTPARYAHLVEFGTEHSAAQPFLRPALDNSASEAIARITENMGRGVMREAVKLKR